MNRASLILLAIIVLAILTLLSFFLVPKILATKYDLANAAADRSAPLENLLDNKPVVAHLPTPSPVKAIYMTACVAGLPTMREGLVKFVEETELNSIIIDVKDYTGTISFPTEDKKLLGSEGIGCIANDLKEFVNELHSKNIYAIARITVFQDPFYSKLKPDLAVKKKTDGSLWKDRKGISYLDPGAKDYWDYIVDLAKTTHDLGFDEINFDYIRFPSDGNMNDIYFPHSDKKLAENPRIGKQLVLEDFFDYLNKKMKEGKPEEQAVISADLFGMTTTNTDDLNIGQVLERTLPYFDYVAPMVYPSHYPPQFNGWADPNKHPYDLIKFVMTRGAERADALKTASTTPEVVQKKVGSHQLRPWLQDFDYGGNYGVAEVQAQIKATYDSGLTSWMIWDPSNKYTRSAFLPQ